MKIVLSDNCGFSDGIKQAFNELQLSPEECNHFLKTICQQAYAAASVRFADYEEIPPHYVFLFTAGHILSDTGCICYFTESEKTLTKNFHVQIVTSDEFDAYVMKHNVSEVK